MALNLTLLPHLLGRIGKSYHVQRAVGISEHEFGEDTVSPREPHLVRTRLEVQENQRFSPVTLSPPPSRCLGAPLPLAFEGKLELMRMTEVEGAAMGSVRASP